jgi:hypothetical protein
MAPLGFMGNNITTIQIQIQTRKLLKKIGHKGESYDRLVRRLIQQIQGVSQD